MEKNNKEFEIKDLLRITKENRYATAVAAFEIIDNFDKLEIDFKKIGGLRNKIAVTSMILLTENLIKYDIITDEQREKLKRELENESLIYQKKLEQFFTEKKKTVFSNSKEELDEEDVGEIEVAPIKDEIGEESASDMDDVDDKDLEESEVDALDDSDN